MSNCTTTGGLTLLLVLCVAAVDAAEKTDHTIDLFVTSASGDSDVPWAIFCEDPQAEPGRVCGIRDGIIIVKPGVRGYIRTEQEFKDFTLTLEWQRPTGTKPGPGGVLIRMTGEDKIWPKSLEAQLNADSAGDFWGLVGYRLDGPSDRLKRVEHEQFGTLTNLKKIKDAEKPVGQWNCYEIVANGEAVTLKINGQLVNRATGCDNVAGRICLTAEGAEIHFRNVQLTPAE